MRRQPLSSAAITVLHVFGVKMLLRVTQASILTAVMFFLLLHVKQKEQFYAYDFLRVLKATCYSLSFKGILKVSRSKIY